METKVEGTLLGTYRPRDGVRFFRVLYPPSEEREALRRFRLLMDRFNQKKIKSECFSLTEYILRALGDLVGCSIDELPDKLRELEKEQDRSELQMKLSEHLPNLLAAELKQMLGKLPPEGVAILLRAGALYPFMSSTAILESNLEGQVPCAIILPYPGATLGSLLDSKRTNPQGHFYRGDIIYWQ